MKTDKLKRQIRALRQQAKDWTEIRAQILQDQQAQLETQVDQAIAAVQQEEATVRSPADQPSAAAAPRAAKGRAKKPAGTARHHASLQPSGACRTPAPQTPW